MGRTKTRGKDLVPIPVHNRKRGYCNFCGGACQSRVTRSKSKTIKYKNISYKERNNKGENKRIRDIY
jgi:hypothetical protein